MRLSFDIGGTFTDVIGLEDDGSLRTTKVLSLLDRVGHDINAFVDARRTGRSVLINFDQLSDV